MTTLRLVGCNTGEGYRGADLLLEIANATGATVEAPWGYVYIGGGCEDLYLETSTGWQTAHPGVRPTPIIESMPEDFGLAPLRIWLRGVYVPVTVDDVERINLFGPGPIDGAPLRSWPKRDVEGSLRLIEFGQPFERGAPAAIETGRIELLLTSRGVEATRTFRILNDNRLQDLTEPRVLYRANISVLRERL